MQFQCRCDANWGIRVSPQLSTGTFCRPPQYAGEYDNYQTCAEWQNELSQRTSEISGQAAYWPVSRHD